MRRLLTAALFAIAALPADAQTCADYTGPLRVPPPLADMAPPPGLLGMAGAIADCSLPQIAMFRADYGAIDRATAPEDVSALHGTWLGDDVLLYVAGLTVPGQEVIALGPGQAPGALSMTQFWYKAAVPGSPPFLYVPGEGYRGMVAEGDLQPGQATGSFAADATGSSGAIRHGTAPLEFERSQDLHVRQRLNRFERPVRFALAGDTLVLHSAAVDPVRRDSTAVVSTYTRVADEAPDMAILLVIGFELSQARNFECFVHQLSEGAGPLIDAMAPFGADEVRAHLEEAIALRLASEAVGARIAKGETAARDEMRTLAEAQADLNRRPLGVHLFTTLPGADLGCLP